MTVCNDSLYILGGYGVGQTFPSDVWSLLLSAVTGTGADARQRPVQPQSLDIAVEDPPARCHSGLPITSMPSSVTATGILSEHAILQCL